MASFFIVVGLTFLACQPNTSSHQKIEPAHVAHIQGSDFNLVTLTQKAMERLDVQTTAVREMPVELSESKRRIVVPYSAVLYDAQGQTWVYTSPKQRSFVRHRIEVDFIDGDFAVLNDGPPVGTLVASVGVAELYGTEYGIGH
jgi:hypothetical protein